MDRFKTIAHTTSGGASMQCEVAPFMCHWSGGHSSDGEEEKARARFGPPPLLGPSHQNGAFMDTGGSTGGGLIDAGGGGKITLLPAPPEPNMPLDFRMAMNV